MAMGHGDKSSLARVCEIRYYGPECYLVLLAWRYSRDEIKEELLWRKEIPEQREAHLNAMWPLDAHSSHMLCSNRMINMWDTLRAKASSEMMASLCPDKYYVTKSFVREIHNMSLLQRKHTNNRGKLT
jgi:hypothetical protein